MPSVGVAASIAAVTLIALSACSLLLKSDQCAADGDCRAKGTAYSTSVCTAGLCTASAVLGDSGPSTPGMDAAIDGGKRECTVTQECADKLGDFAICEKTQGRCVKLLTADCLKVHGDYKNDNAIFVGTLLKMGDTAGDPGASPDALAAIELAFDEFKNQRQGLPSLTNGPSRPLVAVECNQTSNAERAAKHLADDVRVPAIIGASSSYVTLAAATGVTIPRGVLLLSPFASSPALTTLPDNNLVWRVYPSDALQAAAVPKLVLEIERETAAQRGTNPLVVALVHKSDTYGEGLRDIILGGLSFNGKTATENKADGRLTVYDYPNTDEPQNNDYDFTQIVSAILRSSPAPDVVLVMGTSEGVEVYQGIEFSWAGLKPKPYFILPDGIATAPKLAQAIRATPDAGAGASGPRARIRGTIVNSSSGPLFDEFALRFGNRGNPANGASGYDSAYTLAYAMMAAGREPLTGTSIAGGMARLTPPGGTRVGCRPNDIPDALQALQAGAKIDLQGATGNLDFNLATGDVTVTTAPVWCLRPNAAGAVVLETNSGQIFDGAKGALVGTFNLRNVCQF